MKIHLTKALSQIQSTNFDNTENVVASSPTPDDKFESEFEKEKTAMTGWSWLFLCFVYSSTAPREAEVTSLAYLAR